MRCWGLHEMFEDKRIDDNPVYYSEYALSFLPEDFGIYQLNGLDVVGMKHLKKWLRS